MLFKIQFFIRTISSYDTLKGEAYTESDIKGKSRLVIGSTVSAVTESSVLIIRFAQIVVSIER